MNEYVVLFYSGNTKRVVALDVEEVKQDCADSWEVELKGEVVRRIYKQEYSSEYEYGEN
jgi:hypothetical protein